MAWPRLSQVDPAQKKQCMPMQLWEDRPELPRKGRVRAKHTLKFCACALSCTASCASACASLVAAPRAGAAARPSGAATVAGGTACAAESSETGAPLYFACFDLDRAIPRSVQREIKQDLGNISAAECNA